MFFSSMLVTVITVPVIIIQSFSCRQLCIKFLCQLEGFCSVINAVSIVYHLALMSVVRYLTLTDNRYFTILFKHHGLYAVLFCWTMALVWAILPLFGINQYVPEGMGLHCSPDWNDSSWRSRTYFLIGTIFIYLLPLVTIICMNMTTYRTLYRLIQSVNTSTKASEFSTKLIYSNNNNVKDNKYKNVLRLCRLRVDKRLALAGIIVITVFILTWTSYSIFSLIKLIYGTIKPYDNSKTLTICSLLCKMSLLLNPLIYIFTIRTSRLLPKFCLK
ncbi:unnamed protein product [Didymodactylos carnosus]|uniref:G-protein coupled receptors family 1 profile domain-containing protein n=1 Tax=Didymodactylos carnosus TaxID=1234261 RepID=A0A815VJJ4_9BILA|nr:unnamed protein product [Didymodactylos carnosus]CAF1536054.1 unnamed protein product [Didymodactylos carnosus]CAF4213759.1 unnamed protein product [Didymodactylos carnosus]CAF4395915.1 unnamed protein product [Didymodactylos carnosus]